MLQMSLIDQSPSWDDIALLERIWDGERLPPDMAASVLALCRRGLCRPAGFDDLMGDEGLMSVRRHVLTRAGRERLARYFSAGDDVERHPSQALPGFVGHTNVHTEPYVG
ncbi:MAG: hypothetical protein ACK50Q_17845 [Labrys sp. (in: a-proteobacteria)]